MDYIMGKTWVKVREVVRLPDGAVPLNFEPSVKRNEEGWLFYLFPRGNR